jgi:SNF2 family DNA or RNA helicase
VKWRNFNHLRIINLCEMPKEQRFRLINSDYHVYLINPESLVKVLPLINDDFDMLVLDESTKFKDTKTQRFRELRKWLYHFKRRVILTGTPVPNGLQDLFGQMFCVDLGASLGKYVTHFRNEFCYQRPGDLYGWHLRAGAAEQIYRRVANRLMRLDIQDHIQMPELLTNEITVELPYDVRSTYKEMEKNFVIELEESTLAAAHPAAAGTKLRQIANGFVYDEGHDVHWLHNEKLDALEELVEEMQGRPLLVAYEFLADRAAIETRFNGEGGRPTAIDLGKSTNVEEVVRQFNRGLIPLLIAHPASAGHGLNMQEMCNTICWYGITWNLEYYKQFIARIYRSGQASKIVMVHHIVCAGTKDEVVMSALGSKELTQAAFNNAIKGRARVLSS